MSSKTKDGRGTRRHVPTVKWLVFVCACWSLVITGSAAVAVGRWVDLRPQSQVNTLLDIFFIDENHGWAVGHPHMYPEPENALIVRTQDGGDNWTREESGTAYQLHGVHFVTADSGWTVGQNGTVLNTTDSGVTWNAQSFGDTFGLADVYFTDKKHGWIAGFPTAIFRTENGGQDWIHTPVPGVPDDCFLNEIFFVDSLRGCVVGYVPSIASPAPEDGIILRTVDGGQTWTDRTCPDCPPLFGVHFVDENKGWGAGTYAYEPRGAVVSTVDAGDNWVVDQGVYSGPLLDVHFADSLTGWVLGSEEGTACPVMLKTTNGGNNWDPQPVRTTESLLSFCFADSSAWAAGEHGLIARLDESENVWLPLETWGSYSIQDMDFVNAQTGWAVGYRGLLIHTTDSGANWEYQWCGESDILVIEGVDFVDALEGWVVGLGGTAGRAGLIMHTQTAGEIWELQEVVDVNLREVCFVDSVHGWTVGDNFATGERKIYRTSDGGLNWTLIYQDLDGGFLWDILFLDTQNGWVATNEEVWVTTDGGDNWSTDLVEEGLQQLDFLDQWTGWVVGSYYGPKVFHQSMLSSWTAQITPDDPYAPTDQGLFGVDFLNAQSGWAVGNGGAIIRTSNGGEDWAADSSTTLKFLRCVSFPDALHGFAAGYGGIVLRHFGNGDFDEDGDVDLDDYTSFAACFTGTNGGPIGSGCEPGDFDGDGDIDCDDWDQFVEAWTETEDPPELEQCAIPIPTMSKWGFVTIIVLMFAAGTIVCLRKKQLV